MLYITIIVVAILVAGCIITCNYLNHIYDSDLYESDFSNETKLEDCRIIVENIIDKIDIYNQKDEKDKYMYRVSDSEIYSALQNIRKIVTNFNNND